MVDINIALWEAFNDIFFDEPSHKYTNSIGTKFQSVTGWINNFHDKFDAENIAKKCALKRGIDDYHVLLQEWKEAGERSCDLGTQVHAVMEHMWYRKAYYPSFKHDVESDIGKDIVEDFNSRQVKCKEMFNKLKNRFVPVKMEYIVYDVDAKLCGTIDFLAYDKAKNEYAILDYKTNKEIKTNPDQWTKKMYEPFDMLWDNEFGHYSLQLSTYKAILEKNCPDIKIGQGLYLLHIPGEDKPIKSYKCKDVSSIVKEKFLSV